MGDQTGDGGVGDDIINAGDDGLGQSQHVSLVQQLVHMGGELLQYLAHQMSAGALVGLHDFVVLPVDGNDGTVDPAVVLIQLTVGGHEQLGDLQRAQGHHGIEQVLTLVQHLIPQILAEVQQLGLGVVGQIAFPGEGLHERLVTQLHLVDGAAGQCLVETESGGDFSGQSGNVAADVVQRVFEEYAAVAHLDYESALGVTAVADVGGVAVHPDGLCLDVHTQHADVRIVLLQLCHQLFGGSASGVQKFRKTHVDPFFFVGWI